MATETRDHKVRKGETIEGIVKSYGFPSSSAGPIYRAPFNSALRKKAPDPTSLPPGVVIKLPVISKRQIQDMIDSISEVRKWNKTVLGKVQSYRRDLEDMARIEHEDSPKAKHKELASQLRSIGEILKKSSDRYQACLKSARLPWKAVKSPEAQCSRNKGLLQRSLEKAQSKLNGKLEDEKAREAFIQANLQQLAEIENTHGAFDVSVQNFQKVLRDEMGKTY